MSDFIPMDFVGATQSDGTVIYLSSDEKEITQRISASSILDVQPYSEDEAGDVEVMAHCAERQVAEPLPIPNAPGKEDSRMKPTPRPNLLAGPSSSRVRTRKWPDKKRPGCKNKPSNQHV